MKTISFEEMPQTVGEIMKDVSWLKENYIFNQTVKPDTSKKKYSLPQAAEYCCMAEPTFRTYIYKRKVAGTKFGKAWIFLEKDLDIFIEDYRVPTQKELEKEALNKLTNRKSSYHGK